MKLTICIPTLPEPKSQQHLAKLMRLLEPQLNDQADYIIDNRGREVPTGTKRNNLYESAKGEYVVSVDCDDFITPNYVSEILKALESNPDCVTFDGFMTENGGNRQDWTIKLGESYEARIVNGKQHIYRWPNHLAVMRKSIATSVKFPDIWNGEDYIWSKSIKERGLLKTGVHIPIQLYHYIYLTNK